MRGLLVAVSALLLIVAVAVSANQQPDERFSTQDVERAFGGRGLEVGELTWLLGDGTNDDELGVSSPELASGQANVNVLLELPVEHAEFYVFVAANSEIAETYYDRLRSLGPTPDAFDVLA